MSSLILQLEGCSQCTDDDVTIVEYCQLVSERMLGILFEIGLERRLKI